VSFHPRFRLLHVFIFLVFVGGALASLRPFLSAGWSSVVLLPMLPVASIGAGLLLILWAHRMDIQEDWRRGAVQGLAACAGGLLIVVGAVAWLFLYHLWTLWGVHVGTLDANTWSAAIFLVCLTQRPIASGNRRCTVDFRASLRSELTLCLAFLGWRRRPRPDCPQ
jgi:hypothetical protein